nr:aminotransferase class IV [Microbulbifer salipaludis]
MPADEAFSYGVLETMRAVGGRIPLLAQHLARLARAAHPASAIIACIETAAVAIARETAHWPSGARVRLRYGALYGERTWDFSAVPLDANSPWENGVALVRCRTRITPEASHSPFSPERVRYSSDANDVLQDDHPQGCKLLRRDTYRRGEAELGQYTAWLRPDLFCEGLMLDACGHVVEGLHSNLLVCQNGHWRTPSLRTCGVRGVMLGWLASHAEIREDELSLADLEDADEIAVCNAVRGVVPVAQMLLGGAGSDGPETAVDVRNLTRGESTAALQALVASALR